MAAGEFSATDEVILSVDYDDGYVAYLNGQLLYSGDDRWQSRDYRFLGTVGTYDALHLPLRAGTNEVILAISESFGGWAVTGNLVPAAGVRLESE